MAKRKRKVKRKSKVLQNQPIAPVAQIVRVLATWMIKDMKPEEAAVRLLGVGFDALEISDILLVNKNYANNAKARWKKKMIKKVKQQDSD